MAEGSQCRVHGESILRWPKTGMCQVYEGTGTLGPSVKGYLERIAGAEGTKTQGRVNMVFQWAEKSCRKVRWSGPAAQPTDGLLEVPFPLTVQYRVSSLTLITASPTKATPIHPQPIPLTCFPNRSNSVFPVLSKYRIFPESCTSLCRSNSSLAYLFISSLVEGGIL